MTFGVDLCDSTGFAGSYHQQSFMHVYSVFCFCPIFIRLYDTETRSVTWIIWRFGRIRFIRALDNWKISSSIINFPFCCQILVCRVSEIPSFNRNVEASPRGKLLLITAVSWRLAHTLPFISSKLGSVNFPDLLWSACLAADRCFW